MKSIVLVDDHSIFREGLALILSGNGGFRVVGEADTGAGALALLQRVRCDALVVDLSLPDMTGIDLIQQLRPSQPRLPILVLSMHQEEQFVLRAMRAGASGYLTKDTATAELIGALERVMRGEKFLSAKIAERVALEMIRPEQKPPHETLSPRESEIFRLLVAGVPGKQIGARLGVSAKTVSTHRARILEKMGVQSNAELVQYAVRNRLV